MKHQFFTFYYPVIGILKKNTLKNSSLAVFFEIILPNPNDPLNVHLFFGQIHFQHELLIQKTARLFLKIGAQFFAFRRRDSSRRREKFI